MFEFGVKRLGFGFSRGLLTWIPGGPPRCMYVHKKICVYIYIGICIVSMCVYIRERSENSGWLGLF